MTSNTAHLDEAFAIFRDRLGTARHLALRVDEPLTADNPIGIGGPLRALTVKTHNEPFALLGVTTPAVAVENATLLEYFARRARARRIPYLVISNMRDSQILPTPARPGDVRTPLKRYPRLHQIGPQAIDRMSPRERIALSSRADDIAADLAALHRNGSLDLVIPDADFFAERLIRAVGVLNPRIKQAVRTKLQMDPSFRQELTEWSVRQGIPANVRSDDFVESVARQAIYRLLGKIIFYQSLRRAAPELPEMDFGDLDTGQILPRLRDCFGAAHRIDYHAVFREDVVDRLPFPAQASAELRDLVGDLNTRDFAHLPQDVVGVVFERLIPPEERHALGQYFTPERLVDLIVAFCVRTPDDSVLDPTCGTGTFLIRAYDRLRTRLGVHDHNRLLGHLWGVDIAPFPAELATINLFRQRIGDPGNFPRILNDDFFDVVPGGSYRFPPLKSPEQSAPGTQGTPEKRQAVWVDEPISAFDAAVGNFPYISADRIERTVKGYRETVARRLTRDWFQSYPDGFTFKGKTDEKQYKLARENGLPLETFLERANPIISTYADIYVSLFWHAAAFIKEGGRMGFVTSNAWLDVGYGYALQRFLLDHFKIVAVLESRSEPWFVQASVNTVVTVVERCSDPLERGAHAARFVQVKRPLPEVIPWDLHLEGLNRWVGLDGLVKRIEAVHEASDDLQDPKVHEDQDFRLRAIRQGALGAQVEKAKQMVKWGPYLRAPAVYFAFLREACDKLALLRDVAPPARGGTTRINEFFYLDEESIQRWGIEAEFYWPLIKSPSDSNTIRIDPDRLGLRVFVCRKSRVELVREGKLGALQYIEWGERQEYKRGVQEGMKWPDGPWVKNRQPGWYALPKSETHFSRLFFASAYGDRHIQRLSPSPLIADKRLYFLSPSEGVSHELVAALMNSSLVALFTELAGRVTFGDGALELTVEDARDYLRIPDVRLFHQADRQAILRGFQPLLARPTGSVFEEVQKADRQALDAAVLTAMGLEPDHWLPLLYEGLTRLVRERVQLGEMRGQERRRRRHRAASRVADEVLNELLPNGPERFPDDFLSRAARSGAFNEIPLPSGQLRYAGPHFGQEQLTTEKGQTLTVDNRLQVRYMLFAQAAGHTVIRVPERLVEVSRAVNNYVQYLRDLRARLHDSCFKRTLDQAAAERFVDDTWRKFKLPEVEE